MRDHDETPYIVIEREGGGGLGSFILGALVGAGLALLFAPQSGEETQEEIKIQGLEVQGRGQGSGSGRPDESGRSPEHGPGACPG